MLNRYTSVFAAIVMLFISNTTQADIVVAEVKPQIEFAEFYKPANAMLFSGFHTDTRSAKQKQDYKNEEQDTLITRVPVPAAAWLFISGILGLLTVSRRKKEHTKG